MKKLTMVVILIPLVLSGCWDQNAFEKTGFTLQIGVEPSREEGKLLISSSAPAIGGKDKMAIELLTTTARGLMEARENRNRMAAKETRPGKIQQILFSEEIAKQGIHELLETFERDPESPLLAWVVVVEGSPLEMFERASKFEHIPGPALYINQLLSHNIKDLYVAETRIFDFDISYFAPGIDPVTPLLRLLPDDILVVGSALFSGDKMVGKIDHKQTGLLLSMKGVPKTSQFSYISPIPPGMSTGTKKSMAVTLRQSKRNIDVEVTDDKPIVNISLIYDGHIQEYGWDNLSNESIQKKIEKHLAANIKKDCIELVKYMQNMGSDPIGIGDIVRAKYNSYFESVDWKADYKDAEINIDVKVDIKEYGTID